MSSVPTPFQNKGPTVVLESRYSVTIHHFIYLVFHPMKTSHFAALVIIFRNSWGNSQATSETILCLIGKWSLGNEICWCPVTHLLPSPPHQTGTILFLVCLKFDYLFFIWIFQAKGICGGFDFSKLLPSLNSCSCHSRPSTWFQFFWFAPWGPVQGFINVFLLHFFFFFSTPVLSSVAHHSHLFSTIIAVGLL